ncbi:hypothetical protein HW555_013617 [Spodoptera exigua]|uniref:Uncharacterized protein n=1 Tax=Spodoptera exigua TaxID=7107 RepID=A0A835G2J9_SPOEX|nr:hypothetical protein HW555_013617 [Spodoptera exigua]
MKNYTNLRLRQETLEQREFRMRLDNESPEQRVHRLGLIQNRLDNESPEQRAHRLGLIQNRLDNESPEQRAHRLGLIQNRLDNESPEQRVHRLGLIQNRLDNESPEQRAHRLGLIQNRLDNESPEQRAHRLGLIQNMDWTTKVHRLGLIQNRLDNESPEQRAHRLCLIQNRLDNESPEQRAHRLGIIHNRLANESAQEREKRLTTMRQSSQRQRSMIECNFINTINQYAEEPCTVCKKILYPKQKMVLVPTRFEFLTQEVAVLEKNIVCSRCSTTIKKRKVPSQAYWNNMDVMSLPPELADLTDVEQRLVTTTKSFSQSWCRGQVILFAQDVVEAAEQLPLPLAVAGIVVVVETRDNLPNHKQFQVDIRKIKVALINTKYRDVRPNFANIINYDISQIIEVSESNVNEINNENNVDVNHIEVVNKQQISKFISLNNNTSILRGSFHQGSDRLGSSGRQCTAIAAVACVACYKSDPTAWTVSDLDYILIIGDKFYRQCLAAKPEPDPAEINSDYLGATELLPQITFQGSCVNLNIAHDLSINGHFSRDQEGYPNLENGIASFFDNNYTCGILTANFISVCIAYKNLSYWLIDSHARGPKGHKGRTGGVSCCLRFENSRQIAALLRCNLKATGLLEYMLNIYSITPVFVVESGGHIRIESQHSERNLNVIKKVEDFSSKSTTFLDLHFREVIKNLSGDRRLILTTSMLYDIDENIPNLDSVIESDNRNLNENRVTDIHRKTAPLIEILNEKEEWKNCVDGKNGFGESRNISITALDYFQARVMNNETRFQKVDYLVFALSVVGYFRAKASVSTHRHSATCYKDPNNHSCRFGFPRPISNESKCLESDKTLANQGRSESEVMIYNYNLVLLELWQANMDIQPCGNVTAVAYYIAKYASKCEPNDCGDVVREVVQKAKRHSNDVWK